MAEENYIDAIRGFIKKVVRKHSGGSATELSYRSDLEELIAVLGKKIVRPLNEARGTRKIGKPDITVIHSDNIPIGYLEAKDIGIPIRDFTGANKKQFDRYTENLDNLVYTNNLDWDFYRYGKRIYSISIGEYNKKTREITTDQQKFGRLGDYLLDFLSLRPQSIKTPDVLTEHMARRTYMIRATLNESLTGKNRISNLQGEYATVVDELIRGLSKDEFADMYAQTITYGLLAARLNSTPETFSRKELQYLLPKGYPFLSKLLLFIATEDLGDALDFSINDLIGLYRAADINKIMEPYGQEGESEDPFLHFYEEFLKQYNAKERKSKGAYYTPRPVVDFIIRGVDWVLKTKLNLPDGLANSDKIISPDELDPVHKLQILDPATGTGTFLAQTIRHIEKQIKASAEGNWDAYVDEDLLPRLNGFEIMIAPYAMSYLKLDRELERTGYEPTEAKPERMHIYLTNSLAKPKKKIADRSYNKWFVNEAQGAKKIKEAKPIMCVIGNPPYLAESKNKNDWILRLLDDYKKEPDSNTRLQERNPKWLNDDYVKFIRLAQHMVEKDMADETKIDKSREGVVGMITAHGYLDNPTFRGMRWHLMNSFDGIYILDLHGNSRKKEVSPNGEPDKNVFDIQQGVSIIIAWKTKQAGGENKPLAQVFHGDLWGEREEKFKALDTGSLDSELFQKLEPRAPDYLFIAQDYKLLKEYEKGFKINDFMPKNSVGIVTGGDSFLIAKNTKCLRDRLNDFIKTDKNETDIQKDYELGEKYAKRLFNNKAKLKINEEHFIPIDYRLFDIKATYFDDLLIERSRKNIMRHFLKEGNFGLITQRITSHEGAWTDIFMTNKIIDVHITGSQTSTLPLYLDSDDNPESKHVNMDKTIRKAIEDVATDSKHGTPDEVQIFDYIYGILHAPKYRERYSEFLKSDFPRIPYPKTPDEFWHLSSVGTKLRNLHLMKGDIDPTNYKFEAIGKSKNTVERLRFVSNKVFINDHKYFDNVPESAWDFHIGGYQPARKWLKDRKGQTLETNDITHYQKIIAVLVQTEQTMQTIKWSRP